MRIVIITSCTGQKAVGSPNSLTSDDFRRGQQHVRMREEELAHLMRPAAEIYTGQQHIRLMRGIDTVTSKAPSNGSPPEIDLWILSAGYGLVPADRRLAPYECTFADMKARELRKWADMLNVPADIRKELAKPYDLALLLLGDKYLRACDLDGSVRLGGPTIALCGNASAKRLPRLEGLRPVILSKPEARRFSCGLVALKGEVAARVLSLCAKGNAAVQELLAPGSDTLSLLDKTFQTPPQHGRPPEELSRFKHYTPRHGARMLYFIPEWDDRVDPDYDLSCDGITLDRDAYNHDVYSHEVYRSPNYDGILVSKSVIDANRKKRRRIEAIGIHAHIRVPRNFPVMGDCGAFNYIDDESPPYETEETVRYYQALDFDFGVSIDHLIVPQLLERTVYSLYSPDGHEALIDQNEFERLKGKGYSVVKGGRRSPPLFQDGPFLCAQKVRDLSIAKRRWEVTLENAREFLESHRRLGCTFVPIAGCQGWDAESQAEMFRLQQEMGYQYIALGGLVRSQTQAILEVLDLVNRIRRPGTKVHLFGVARPEAIPEFLRAGVDSVDSARFLRQAWLSATSNYYAGDPEVYAEHVRQLARVASARGGRQRAASLRYTALRIPPVVREGGSALTAKARAVVEKGMSQEELHDREDRALALVHAFDKGEASLEETLAAVVEYDILMGGDKRNEPLYRQLLEDRPWQACPCDVCQETGIDVAIFRRNNRNRRRGFHNTWWFFRFFSKITGEE